MPIEIRDSHLTSGGMRRRPSVALWSKGDITHLIYYSMNLFLRWYSKYGNCRESKRLIRIFDLMPNIICVCLSKEHEIMILPLSLKEIIPWSNALSRLGMSAKPSNGSRRSSLLHLLQGLMCDAVNSLLSLHPVTAQAFRYDKTLSRKSPCPRRLSMSFFA